ncbi:MAG: HEAT repeat domain-containing protein [Myxococcota bacterium]
MHPLVARLSDPDPAVRLDACRAAPRDPSAVLLADALLPLLGDPDPAVAAAASDALAAIASGDASVLPHLDAALRGENRDARWWSAFTLARLGPPKIKLLPVLLDTLEHPDGGRRWSAAKLLVELGRLEGEVLPVLLHFAGGGERPTARRMALFALRELAPDRPETTRVLLEASRSDDTPVRRAALSALAVVLEDADAARERLAEAAVRDADPASRRLAEAALAEMERRRTP